MKKHWGLPAFLLAVLAILLCSVLAHSGRTDRNGGHYDRSTGEYHYHHGMEAHQHPNGVCPYKSDGERKHTSTGSSKTYASKEPQNGAQKTNSSDSNSGKKSAATGIAYAIVAVYAVFSVFIGLVCIVASIADSISKRKKRRK